MFNDLSRTLIAVGVLLIVLGILWQFISKIPGLGRLPGDILIKRENFTFYFPLATSILISVVLSLILYLCNRK